MYVFIHVNRCVVFRLCVKPIKKRVKKTVKKDSESQYDAGMLHALASFVARSLTEAFSGRVLCVRGHERAAQARQQPHSAQSVPRQA